MPERKPVNQARIDHLRNLQNLHGEEFINHIFDVITGKFQSTVQTTKEHPKTTIGIILALTATAAGLNFLIRKKPQDIIITSELELEQMMAQKSPTISKKGLKF